MNLEASAITSVSFYVATGPVEACDRCATGIRNVFIVNYRDGFRQKYGSECINKVLAVAPTLKTLFNTNAKRLKKYQDYQRILTGPVDQMPRGREYYNAGLYFIADSEGKDISFNSHWFFHPVVNVEKNAASDRRLPSVEEFAAKQAAEFKQRDQAKLASEIARLEAFLGKILRNLPKGTIL